MVLGSVLLGACAAEPPAEPKGGPLAAGVEAIAASGVVGVQAATRLDARESWSSAGVRERDGSRGMTPHSRFRIGSTSKAFLATTLLGLVERGQLSLEDRLERWLPGVVDRNGNDGRRITLRQLLQHTSGLNNHVDDQMALLAAAGSADAVDALLQRSWTQRELVELALQHPPPFEPGAGWAYTDTGYVLLGMVIESVTGQPWDTRVATDVIQRLGLADTSIPRAERGIAGEPMHGYSELPWHDGLVDVTEIQPSALDAAGALISTPTDLARFFSALLGGDLLAAATLEAMKTTIPIEDEAGPRYGLGLAWLPSACGGYWSHDGDTVGFHTRVGVSETGRASVAIAISGDGDFEPAASDLIESALCGGH